MTVPKLNLHAKSLFLKHRVKRLFKYYFQGGDLVSPSEFLKCLLVSRQFLRASQLYRIYQLVVVYFNSNHTFEVYFGSTKVTGNGSDKLELTLPQIKRLNQLLSVQHFYVYNYNHTRADEYSELCKVFKNHIKLKFSAFYDTSVHLPFNILNQLNTQLYLLVCDVGFLVDPTKVVRLKLGECYLERADSFYQLKSVLTNHQIKKLKFTNLQGWNNAKIFDEAIKDNYFDDFPKCYFLHKLTFKFNQLDEKQDILSKLTDMVAYFPNLSFLWCMLFIERYNSERFGLQDLSSWLLKENKRISCLLKACSPTTYLQLCYSIHIYKRESGKAVKEVIKQFLKTTNLNKLCYFQQRVHKEQQSIVFELERDDPGLYEFVRVVVDLDPQTLNDVEVIREDDNLLVPLSRGFFRFDDEFS